MPKGLLLSAAILAGAVLVSAEQRPPAGDPRQTVHRGEGRAQGSPPSASRLTTWRSTRRDRCAGSSGARTPEGGFRGVSRMGAASRWKPSRSWTCPLEAEMAAVDSSPPTVRRRRADQRRPIRRTGVRAPARRSAHRVRPHAIRPHNGAPVRGTERSTRAISRPSGARLRARGCEPGLHERPPPAACVASIGSSGRKIRSGALNEHRRVHTVRR